MRKGYIRLITYIYQWELLQFIRTSTCSLPLTGPQRFALLRETNQRSDWVCDVTTASLATWVRTLPDRYAPQPTCHVEGDTLTLSHLSKGAIWCECVEVVKSIFGSLSLCMHTTPSLTKYNSSVFRIYKLRTWQNITYICGWII